MKTWFHVEQQWINEVNNGNLTIWSCSNWLSLWSKYFFVRNVYSHVEYDQSNQRKNSGWNKCLLCFSTITTTIYYFTIISTSIVWFQILRSLSCALWYSIYFYLFRSYRINITVYLVLIVFFVLYVHGIWTMMMQNWNSKTKRRVFYVK